MNGENKKTCNLPQCGKPLPERASQIWHDGLGFNYCSEKCASLPWKSPKSAASIPVKFFCPICNREYNTMALAEACRDTPFEPTLKVGDIVTAGGDRFGWFDGDKNWIAETNKGRGLDGKTYAFYYVVTLIDHEEDGHRPRYHLATLAMTEDTGYGSGWTYDIHHLTPRRVENPPVHLLAEAKLKGLIGKPARGLL